MSHVYNISCKIWSCHCLESTSHSTYRQIYFNSYKIIEMLSQHSMRSQIYYFVRKKPHSNLSQTRPPCLSLSDSLELRLANIPVLISRIFSSFSLPDECPAPRESLEPLPVDRVECPRVHNPPKPPPFHKNRPSYLPKWINNLRFTRKTLKSPSLLDLLCKER